jgi:hypothetical protein
MLALGSNAMVRDVRRLTGRLPAAFRAKPVAGYFFGRAEGGAVADCTG